MENKSLFEKIGGFNAIALAVDIFFNEKIMKDERINHFFKHSDINKQIKMQIAFLISALGGPKKYFLTKQLNLFQF